MAKRSSANPMRPALKKHISHDGTASQERIGLARKSAFKPTSPQAGHGKAEPFFVPPPPPMVYTWPAPRAFFAPVDQAPVNGSAALKPGKPVAPEKSANSLTKSSTHGHSISSDPTLEPIDLTKDLLPALPAKLPVKAVKESSPQAERAPSLERISPLSPNLHVSAPAPGNDSPQELERISVPH